MHSWRDNLNKSLKLSKQPKMIHRCINYTCDRGRGVMCVQRTAADDTAVSSVTWPLQTKESLSVNLNNACLSMGPLLQWNQSVKRVNIVSWGGVWPESDLSVARSDVLQVTQVVGTGASVCRYNSWSGNVFATESESNIKIRHKRLS